MILDDINNARLKIIQYRLPNKGLEVHPTTYRQLRTEIPEFRIEYKNNNIFIGRIFGIDVYSNPNVPEGEVRIIK